MFGFYTFGHPYFAQGPGEVEPVAVLNLCRGGSRSLMGRRLSETLMGDRRSTSLMGNRVSTAYCENEE